MLTEFERRLCSVLLLAAKVREAQDDFYRNGRTQLQLITAKKLERQLDEVIGPTMAEARQRGWSDET